ncbi:FAD-binding domain-containing protein [Xylaria sp. FL0064]|nr:FAD-binding domain-containing protein [Xylaria sp. FL0064]
MQTKTRSLEAACRKANWPSLSDIQYRGSEAFTKATARWNAYGSPSYCAAVSPSSEEENASIVKVAAAASIPFLATGGRHGYGTTLKKLQNGLAIDLSRLNSVTIDKNSSTVTIGGGAKIRDVLKSVSEAGFQIPSGSCNSAGYIGAGLGAGIGYLQGTLGLVIDSLVSAKLVTANGDLIDLSEPVNKGDIFYVDLIYGAGQKSDYFKMMQTFNDNMPSRLGFSTTLFWNASANETGLLATLIYAGTESEARKELSCFFDINPTVAAARMISFTELPSVVIMGIADASCDTVDGLHSIHTLNIRQFVADAYDLVFDKFDSFLKQYPDSRTSALIFETFSNQAVVRVPNERTAYPWRDAKGYFMLQLRWTGLDNPFGNMANAFAKELRADLVDTSGYSELSAYVSYAYGDETLDQKFGRDKLSRLMELKREWDPRNVFGYCNPLLT